ncbi:MAG: hypothetical protein JJU21_16435 [Salinarimonas sp.]|nr:hypothetical protein [Salinarimonas sp.]
MFSRVFLQGRHGTSSTLVHSLEETFFANPSFDEEIRSNVYEEEGSVRGFIGITPLRIDAEGVKIRCAIGGSLMVDPDIKDPLIGARLLRSFSSGPQSLTFSETANRTSHAMWTRSGARFLPVHSLDFVRILKPAGFALENLAEQLAALRVARPVTHLIDRFASGLIGSDLMPKAQRGVRSTPVAREDIPGVIMALMQNYALRPDWRESELDWLIERAWEKPKYGKIHAAVVENAAGRRFGFYLAYLMKRGKARLMHVVAGPKDSAAVLEAAARDAFEAGCIAVEGRADPRVLPALIMQRCLLFRRTSTIAQSRLPRVIDNIDAGDAFIGGLAGETWSPLHGGEW